jgi:hypothetical protein
VRLGAGFDPAVTLNACALAIVGEVRPGIWAPLVLKTWQGRQGEPLDIRLGVGQEAAELVRRTGLTEWMSDLFAQHDVELVSKEAGLIFRKDEAELLTSFGTTRHLLHARPEPRLILRATDPDLDDLCQVVAKELGGVLLKRKAGGKSEITIPTIGGRHGDLARALVRALWHAKAAEPSRAGEAEALQELNALQRHPRATGPIPYRTGRGAPFVNLKHPRSR